MDHIDINVDSGYLSMYYAHALIDDYGVDCISAVRLNTAKGIPNDSISSEEWPVIFECKDSNGELEIRIRSMSSGNQGNETSWLIKLLKYAGFIFDKQDVYTKKFDHERWTKE